MGYTAKAVANYFIGNYGTGRFGTRFGAGISPLRLQKLVYISHGWHLALRDKPLVDDEHAEAWQYGPVFPSLYYEFKDFGDKPITRKAQQIGPDLKFTTPEIPEQDEETAELLDRVWDVYRGYTAIQLSALTHAKDTPWYKARQQFPGVRNVAILNDSITAHYKEKIEAQG